MFSAFLLYYSIRSITRSGGGKFREKERKITILNDFKITLLYFEISHGGFSKTYQNPELLENPNFSVFF